MPAQYPLRLLLRVAPALVAVSLVACGRSPLGPEVEALDTPDATGDDSGGLPTKSLDAGLEMKDTGLETKDAGLGTKEAGVETKDSGLETEDAGPGTVDAETGTDAATRTLDAGTGTVDAGADSGAEDAGTSPVDAGMAAADGGALVECFVCAEQMCEKAVSTCASSRACVEEGNCELACLGDSAGGATGRGFGGFGGLNLRCFDSCVRNPRASRELFEAMTCAFALCPTECRGVLTPVGGAGH